MPTPEILKGFLLTKEACARFNRSHRQLNRDRVKAMRLGESKVTAHFKLQLENGDVISGEDLTIEQISTFRDEGRNPAWYVEAAWMEETYGKKGDPPRQQSTDANDVSSPEGTAAEEGTSPVQPVRASSVLDMLKDQLDRERQQNALLVEQLKIKDEQIRRANAGADQSHELMSQLHVLLKNMQDRLLPEPKDAAATAAAILRKPSAESTGEARQATNEVIGLPEIKTTAAKRPEKGSRRRKRPASRTGAKSTTPKPPPGRQEKPFKNLVSDIFPGRICYPELVRSTFHGPGPTYDRDDIGTSFAAPKVTHIAAHLQRILPDEPCLLYRALIVQSARWPEWTNHRVDTNLAIRTLGYGVPNLERATTNTDYRTTLISSGETGIRRGDCDVYQVPIPEVLRSPGYEYDVLIEVTLSYVAQPRRTRRNLRRYLSTWVDWKSSKLGESIESFRRRALKDQDGDDNSAQGTTLHWTLGARSDQGDVEGAKRSSGTVQKDWAIVKSNQLPENFCIAVMGHEGWSKDPAQRAGQLRLAARKHSGTGEGVPLRRASDGYVHQIGTADG